MARCVDAVRVFRSELVLTFELPFQTSLAYLTAATHGLEAEAEQLRDILEASGQPVPSVNPSATLLQPPVPIAKTEHNWPLLVVSKVILSAV